MHWSFNGVCWQWEYIYINPPNRSFKLSGPLWRQRRCVSAASLHRSSWWHLLLTPCCILLIIRHFLKVEHSAVDLSGHVHGQSSPSHTVLLFIWPSICARHVLHSSFTDCSFTLRLFGFSGFRDVETCSSREKLISVMRCVDQTISLEAKNEMFHTDIS